MSSFDIEFAAVTDIGKIREKNEDNVLISSDLGLGVVADGMGGHSAGEIASNIAVSVLAETIRKINTNQLKIPENFLPKLDLTERKLLMAANLANAAIYSTAQSSDIYRMMGTTLTGILFDGYLVAQGIIVRNRNKVQLCGNCLRITIGNKSENAELLGALRQY